MPRVQVDHSPVECDNAAELIIHHLACAAALFQALPDDSNERETLMSLVEERFQGWGIEKAASTVFVDSLCQSYDALKEGD